MTSPPTKRDGETDHQATGLYPAHFDYANMNAVLMDPYVNTFNNMYISPPHANDGNCSIPPPSNIWPAETVAAPVIPVADAITSPTVPTHYILVPTPGPFVGGALPTSNEGQTRAEIFECASPHTPWWLSLPSGAGSNNNLMTTATSFDTTISNSQDDSKTANMAFTKPAANLTQLDPLSSLQRDSFPRRTSMSLAAGSSEAARDFESSTSRPAASSTHNIGALQRPTTPDSDGGLITPGDKDSSQRRPASFTGAKRSSDAQQTSPILSPKAQPEKRSRNRAAAHKWRAKSKAAVAALKASEKTESQRHSELLRTLKTLQADVLALKNEILLHANCSDMLIQKYLDSAARSFVPHSAGAGAASLHRETAGDFLMRTEIRRADFGGYRGICSP